MEKERDFSLGRLVFKIVLVIAFVFLLMWLFPMPNLNPVYDRIFADNINTMKEAGQSYYTVDRLPKEVNASVSMTLAEMLAKKFVLPIADSDGKLCDGEASYVQITKTDKANEYILKANLVCPNKADYIIEYMGCYDLCPTVCNCGTDCKEPVKEATKVTPQKTEYVTRYQLQRTWFRGIRQNTGPSYTEYKHERYEKVQEFDRYSCPAGVLVGSTCHITTTSTRTETAAPIAKTNTSTRTETAAPIAKTNTSTRTETAAPIAKTNTSTRTETAAPIANTNTTYSCPSGYTQGGSGASTTCSRQITTSTDSWVYVGTVTSKTALSSTSTIKYVSIGSSTKKDCSVCASYVLYEYKKYKLTSTPSTRTETAAPIANTNTKYSCPSGYTQGGSGASTTCSRQVATSRTTYSCPIGFISNGSGASMTCSRKMTDLRTTYSCPSGYAQSGSGASMTCSRQVASSSVRIVAAERIMRTVRVLRDVIWTRNASEPGYVMVEQRIIPGGSTTVDSGWVLSLPAGYRQTDTKVEYKWSSNKTQSGWTFTGKTTTVKK